jgi:hypothetical protein
MTYIAAMDCSTTARKRPSLSARARADFLRVRTWTDRRPDLLREADFLTGYLKFL